ncbi:MAG: prepilin-type N-terminal cleavage/methylation domain-containing protein [Patescibacteria group bacterium]|nr:MAG: prepilin-type N-terminal cleavage/methylation domain-containing protein [Patescibacteria group bacterium]
MLYNIFNKNKIKQTPQMVEVFNSGVSSRVNIRLNGKLYNNKEFIPGANKTSKAFTLIELLVVIAIIGVLSTLVIVALGNSRAGARDAKRLNDLRSMTNALELYYADHGSYPDTQDFVFGESFESGDTIYLASLPQNPTPYTDGTCPNENYTYESTGQDYVIHGCIGNPNNTLSAGMVKASPGGVQENPFPIVRGFQETIISVSLVTHTVNLPNYEIGDLVVIFSRLGTSLANIPTTPTGWNVLVIRANDGTSTIYWKIMNGTEDSSVDISSNTDRRAVHHSYSIRNFNETNPISGVFASSNITDPPNLTSGFGNVSALWFAMVGNLVTVNNQYNTPPTNYNNFKTGVALNSSGSTVSVRMATARRELVAASEDPGLFGMTGTANRPQAATVAIQGRAP